MKAILITGANRGLGLAFVQYYLGNGWHVLACCRQPAQATVLNQLKIQYPNQLQLFPLDVTSKEKVDQLANKLKDIDIDILLNNAGVWGPKETALGTINDDDWQTIFATNTLAPLFIAQAFAKQVANSQLKIMASISSNLASIGGNNEGDIYLYRSSKAALNAIVKSLSVDLKSEGITVVALHPGWVKTDMGGEGASLEPAESAARLSQVLDTLNITQTGQFISHEGNELSW